MLKGPFSAGLAHVRPVHEMRFFPVPLQLVISIFVLVLEYVALEINEAIVLPYGCVVLLVSQCSIPS